MYGMELLKALTTLGPILSLLALGFAITLRGGVAGLSSGHEMRRLTANLTLAVLTLGACLVALVLLQGLAGVHLGL